jgi:prolyl oligopeptidase
MFYRDEPSWVPCSRGREHADRTEPRYRRASAGGRFHVQLLTGLCVLLAGCGESANRTPAAKSPSTTTATPVDDAEPTSSADAGAPSPLNATTFRYPKAERGDQVDDYHGRQVADPFRWLEDTDSPATRTWIKAENELTFDFLKAVPQRAQIHDRLTKLWNYEKYGIPAARGGRYFYNRNDGLQNQSVLYVASALDAEPQVLLDPNTLSADGTVALSGTAISDDGRLFAYGLATAGSDWQEWRIRDVETKRDLPDRLQWIKFATASWSPDGRGLFYSRYDEPDEQTRLTGVNYFQKLFYHRLGTPQAEDKLIYERPDEKEWGFNGDVSDDGHWLVIRVWRGSEIKDQLFYLDLTTPDAQVVPWITGFDAQYAFLGNDGNTFFLRTDFDAPRQRVVAADCTQPGREGWNEIIPEQQDVLQSVSLVGDRLIALYLQDAHSQVRLFDKSGQPQGEIPLAEIGTVALGNARQQDQELFYSFTSFLAAPTIYRYDVTTGKSTVFRQPKVDFAADRYLTEQVFYTSRDGTRVPMFITRRKDTKLDGTNPTFLFAYGGFDISLTPSFSPGRFVWLEMGGIYAQPNLRGGGEYGRAWHEAGMKAQKQNVFDDFLAAAEWLTANKYTSREKLAIAGRSNGGLLVGAALTQRPDLFGAALPGVGVMDMLRFHRFTIGWAWVSEYGSADNAEDFPTLSAYSPLHNIKPGIHYPATLVTTADHDDRVVPGHSFKFAATLQAAQAGPRPILIRIETSAGHGAGTPTTKLIEEAADGYAFLVKELAVDVPQDWGTSENKTSAATKGEAAPRGIADSRDNEETRDEEALALVASTGDDEPAPSTTCETDKPMPYIDAKEQLVAEIFVRDLDRSVAFYRDLGFELVRKEGDFAELAWEGHLLFVDQRSNLPPVPDFPAANTRVMVPDVDRHWKLCAENKARVVAPIGNRYYGLRDFTVADPDGYGVRFATRLTDAKK